MDSWDESLAPSENSSSFCLLMIRVFFLREFFVVELLGELKLGWKRLMCVLFCCLRVYSTYPVSVTWEWNIWRSLKPDDVNVTFVSLSSSVWFQICDCGLVPLDQDDTMIQSKQTGATEMFPAPCVFDPESKPLHDWNWVADKIFSFTSRLKNIRRSPWDS